MQSKTLFVVFIFLIVTWSSQGQNSINNQLSLGVGFHSVQDAYSSNFTYSGISPLVAWERSKYNSEKGKINQLNVQYQYTKFSHPVLAEREEVQFISHRAVVNYNQLWDVSNQNWFIGFNATFTFHGRLNNYLANGGSVYDGIVAVGFVAHYRKTLSNNHQVEGTFRLPILAANARPDYAYSNIEFNFGTLNQVFAPLFHFNYHLPLGDNYFGLGLRSEYYRIDANNRRVYNLTNNLLLNYKF